MGSWISSGACNSKHLKNSTFLLRINPKLVRTPCGPSKNTTATKLENIVCVLGKLSPLSNEAPLLAPKAAAAMLLCSKTKILSDGHKWEIGHGKSSVFCSYY